MRTPIRTKRKDTDVLGDLEEHVAAELLPEGDIWLYCEHCRRSTQHTQTETLPGGAPLFECAICDGGRISMTELLYEPIPDQCKVYPVSDDDFSTMENAEVNSAAWTAHIHTPGEIKSVTDPDGNVYTSFEQLRALGIVSFKLVAEHHVELDDIEREPPDVDDGIHDGRDFDEPYATPKNASIGYSRGTEPMTQRKRNHRNARRDQLEHAGFNFAQNPQGLWLVELPDTTRKYLPTAYKHLTTAISAGIREIEHARVRKKCLWQLKRGMADRTPEI